MTTKPRTLEEATSLAESLKRAVDATSLSCDEFARAAATMGIRRLPASPVQVEWPRATGRALTAIALDMYGMRRRWYERIPWFGDRWLRRRMRDAWKSVKLVPFTAIVDDPSSPTTPEQRAAVMDWFRRRKS